MRLIPKLIAPMLIAFVLPLAVQASPLLPDRLLQSIKADPAAYLDSVTLLIASYGAADGITEEQVDTSLALVRAKARSAANRPLDHLQRRRMTGAARRSWRCSTIAPRRGPTTKRPVAHFPIATTPRRASMPRRRVT